MSNAPIKMLSIDDRMLTTDLDRAGYRNMGIFVKQVVTFKEAQSLIERDQIDIIVINYDYDKIDAMTICKHFKKQEATKNTPIVITSVQTSASVRNAALEAGADLFVEQPLPRQYFIEKLKKLLSQQTRSNDRVGLQDLVSVKLKNATFELPIGDISSSGMLVASDFAVTDGERVELSFVVPGYRKPIEIQGVVVRKIATMENGNAATTISGVGIRFEKFIGDSEKRLEKYIDKTADKQAKMIYYL
jgi:CheY-like chemotaxis protein